jgi:hypothetical protein
MNLRLTSPGALGCGAALLLSACGAIVPSSIEFVDVSPPQPRIGDIATVRFRALDDRGQPMAGAELQFSIPENTGAGGVRLHPASALTGRGDGMATTTLTTTGPRPASVSVQARVGTELSAISPSITFSGTNAPNGRELTFQCGSISGAASGGVHAIGAYDSTRHLIAGVKLECHAHVADRNGAGIPNALVSFLTEAGTVEASGLSMSDVIGNAKMLHKTAYPLPKDVTPVQWQFTNPAAGTSTNTGIQRAPMWMHPFLWTADPIQSFTLTVPPDMREPRRADPLRQGFTNNPRDNLVTLIAVTAGEEGFVDSDNNGVQNGNEPFDDLTEPFVDSDDNGTWDPDERWIDTDGDGVWDGKDGRWNPSTLIWTQERIIWTGVPHPWDISPPPYVTAPPTFRQVSPPGPAGSYTIQHYDPPTDFTVIIADPWFNALAQNGDTDGCEIPNIEGKKLINVNPTSFSRGVRFTYPPYTIISTVMTDAHDITKQPPDPAFPSAEDFNVPVSCLFTASPFTGHQVVLPFAITGRVF